MGRSTAQIRHLRSSNLESVRNSAETPEDLTGSGGAAPLQQCWKRRSKADRGSRLRHRTDADVVQIDRCSGAVAIDDESQTKERFARGKIEPLLSECLGDSPREDAATSELDRPQLDILASARKILGVIPAPGIHIGSQLEKGAETTGRSINIPIVADQIGGFGARRREHRLILSIRRIGCHALRFLKIPVAQ